MEQINNAANGDTPINKPPRVRSVAYASNTISHCVELTKRIHQIFGNTVYANRDSLSKQLKISDSHLQTQLSSCVQYELLELKNKEGYKPTQRFTQIYKPLNDAEKNQALLECFQSPDLYIKLIEQFSGKDLPTEGGLATILFRGYKVSEGASLMAARIFIENTNELNLVKDGILSIKNIQEEDTEDIIENEQVNNSIINDSNSNRTKLLSAPENNVKVIKDVLDLPPIPILLSNNRVAKLYVPEDYTVDDFKRIAKVIQAYLPD